MCYDWKWNQGIDKSWSCLHRWFPKKESLYNRRLDNCVRKYLDFQVEMQIHMRELQEPAQIQALQMQQMELGRQMGL